MNEYTQVAKTQPNRNNNKDVDARGYRNLLPERVYLYKIGLNFNSF